MSIDNASTIEPTQALKPEMPAKREDEDILDDADFLVSARNEQAAVHQQVLDESGSSWEKEGSVIDRLKNYFAGALEISDDFREKERAKARESLAAQVLERRLKALEEAGAGIVGKKNEMAGKEKSAEKARKDAEADMAKYEQSMREHLSLFENDPNLKDSFNELSDRMAAEKSAKELALDELRYKEESQKQESEAAISEAVDESGFEAGKEKLAGPLNAKLEDLGGELEQYNNLHAELRAKKSYYFGEVNKYNRVISKLGKSETDTFLKERYNEALEKSKERLQNFENREKAIKIRLDLIRGEKSKTEAYLRRLNGADKTPAEKSAARKGPETAAVPEQASAGGRENAYDAEKKSRETDEKEMIEAFGGAERYERIVSGLYDPHAKEGWKRYLQLSPEERRYEDLRFDPKQAGGDTAKLISIMNVFAKRFEKESSLRTQDQWASLLFGEAAKRDDKTREGVAKALSLMPKNIMNGLYSEEWAINLYIAFRKTSTATVNEKDLREEAKKRVEDAIANEERARTNARNTGKRSKNKR